ncbi:uncharacterized protein CELE_F43G9.8 [Caenorhabditis elegans]|uniref:Uncharacterized protein n=1 Tax=Caenorhabditis elegans TaxID=6239 RepID=Q93720_CAEEL|nr:Uncharacterized protein CELE_F43G9.8 [Caenorhabditis elegans]CAB02110.2 Uncharacterized protein CELE_F43G9.8 [Caenorhabditis elegans]|eukprot:NP_492335.2 Uncharacterized protein CELE_F43G9.8 [Caenorhabditis elegans]
MSLTTQNPGNPTNISNISSQIGPTSQKPIVELWDDEGQDFFMKTGAYIMASFILQILSVILLMKIIRIYMSIHRKNMRKKKMMKLQQTKQEDPPSAVLPSPSHFTTQTSTNTVEDANMVLEGNEMLMKHRARLLKPTQKRTTKDGNSETPSTHDGTRKIVFQEKGQILLNTNNVTEYAVMDGEDKPGEKINIKKVTFDFGSFVTYNVGIDVDEWEEPIEKIAGSAGSGGSVMTASIKQKSIKRF